MSIFSRKRKVELRSAMTVGLTPLGKDLACSSGGVNGKKGRIIETLNQGERPIGQLASELEESCDKVKKILISMKGLVRFDMI